jgi:hypothetical protein
MDKKIGIILINYRDYARRFLTTCRDSLRQQNYPQELISVYIIDNGATLETTNYLQEIYPEAEIIPRLDGNYAAANNLGFQIALQEDCDYIVSVNMDTEMDICWLKELVKALDENPRAGIAQSKVLLFPKDEAEKENPRVNSLGNVIHFLGFGFTSFYGQVEKINKEQGAYPLIKGYASGCSFIIRSEVLLALDLDNDGKYYNEEYYMYHDDLELSLKVKLTGYQIILEPLSRIFHKYEFTRSTKMIYYMERNRYLTMMIFYPRYLLLIISLPALIVDIALLFYSFFGSWFKEELKIYRYFLKSDTYDKILTARERVKRLKGQSFSVLAKDFSGKIEFQEIANPVLKYVANPILNAYWFIVKKII